MILIKKAYYLPIMLVDFYQPQNCDWYLWWVQHSASSGLLEAAEYTTHLATKSVNLVSVGRFDLETTIWKARLMMTWCRSLPYMKFSSTPTTSMALLIMMLLSSLFLMLSLPHMYDLFAYLTLKTTGWIGTMEIRQLWLDGETLNALEKLRNN